MAKNQFHFNIKNIQIFKAKLGIKLLTRRRRYFYFFILNNTHKSVMIKIDTITKQTDNVSIHLKG